MYKFINNNEIDDVYTFLLKNELNDIASRIKNNAGDEYFQAMIIDTLDYIDINKVINCLKNILNL